MHYKLLSPVILFTVLFAAGVQAATGYSENFSGATSGWDMSNQNYKVVQANGSAAVTANTNQMWQGIWFSMGATADISAHPYVNVKIKADDPFVLTFYVFDNANKAHLFTKSIRTTAGFVNYCFDLTGVTDMDLTHAAAFQFTANGAANGWQGTFHVDDLLAGDQAGRFATMDGVPDQLYYVNSGAQNIALTGLDHVASIAISGADTFIQNAAITALLNNAATLSFQLKPNVTGSKTAVLTLTGTSGYASNTVSFLLGIEGNLAPTIAQVANIEALVNKPRIITLGGIGDGNATVQQTLTITAASSNDAVIANPIPAISYTQGSPNALLTFTPKAAGVANVTVTVNDGQSANNSAAMAFTVTSYSGWNNPPTLDSVPAQSVFADKGNQTVNLTGISNGDNNTQTLLFTATSSAVDIVANPVITYQSGAKATLTFTPNAQKTGKAIITITLKDNGGTSANNGDLQIQRAIAINTRLVPLTALTDKFDAWATTGARWKPEASIAVSSSTMDAQPVMKVQCTNKWTFAGLWYACPDLDVSKYPYITVDLFTQDSMEVTAWLYDQGGSRNDGASHVIKVRANTWTTVPFDYSGPTGLVKSDNSPIDASWITGLLFNFHCPSLSWPFTNYTGTLYLRNLRVGSAANVPTITPQATVNGVPHQAVLENSDKQTILLSGITDGKGGAGTIVATSDNGSLIANPTIGVVGSDRTALLSYTAGSAGTAHIKLVASGLGSRDSTISFTIQVLSAQTQNAEKIAVDLSAHHQTMRGFGAFDNSYPASVYAGDWGASAMRVGLIGNQIEPANDNNNPLVLNIAGLDYTAFNWTHLRSLHEAGVENFILTSWSPPAWMKTNLSLSYQQAGFSLNTDQTDNKLDPRYYDEFAESMVAAYRLFQYEAGISLTGIGIQNEPTFHEPYASAILDPSHFVQLIKVVGARLKAEGITTKLYMPEQVFSQGSMYDYITALNADPTAQDYSDVIATHGYAANGIDAGQPDFSEWTKMWNQSQAGKAAKELWMTETELGYKDFGTAFFYAQAIYGALEFGNVSLWTVWSVDGQFFDRGVPNSSYYATKHFYRYIRPGAVRVTSTSPDKEVLVSSFKNDSAHGGNVVCEIINLDTAAKAITVTLSGGTLIAPWLVFRTDAYTNCAFLGEKQTADIITLPPQSITTLAEKRNDLISSPVARVVKTKAPSAFRIISGSLQSQIRFFMPAHAPAVIEIFNVLGRKVDRMELLQPSGGAGSHQIVIWDGSRFGKGLYIARVRSGLQKWTARFVLER